MFGLFKTKPKGYENISAAAFLQKMEEAPKDVIVVDVRTPSEAASGMIPGAKLMNLMESDFGRKMAILPKDKTILVYCRSGSRSASAAGMLVKAGYSSIYNLSGGIVGWSYKTVHPPRL